MAIKFLLLVNKHGQTRLARYLDQNMTVEERRAMEGEIVRKCLRRTEKQVIILLYGIILTHYLESTIVFLDLGSLLGSPAHLPSSCTRGTGQDGCGGGKCCIDVFLHISKMKGTFCSAPRDGWTC